MRVRDEVCGMTIDADDAAGMVKLDGRTWYFCSEHCRRLFEESRDAYVQKTPDGEQQRRDPSLRRPASPL